MPPLRFHKNPESARASPPIKPLNEEAEDQFDAELSFCIDQLQKTLEETNINQKKRDETTKAINILKNPKQLKIRKRQLMKTYVGDYRSKMADLAAEPESAKSNVELEIKNSNAAGSTFIKKAITDKGDISEKQEFLFNFKLETTSVCDDDNDINGDRIVESMDLRDSTENGTSEDKKD